MKVRSVDPVAGERRARLFSADLALQMKGQTVKDASTSRSHAIEVVPVNGFIGAEIKGADLSRPLSDEEFGVIHDAFCRYEVIFFRNQDINVEQQSAFGRRFGELLVHPFAPNDDKKPELIVFDNSVENPPTNTDMWHADETYRRCPPTATILRSITVPERGGDTLFSSMTSAYRGLSEEMKRYLHKLRAVHDFKPWRPMFNTPALRQKLLQLEEEFPNQLHPVVRLHPVTGRRVLYVNQQFVLRIDGVKADESACILDYLYRQAQVPEYQLRLKWEKNMVVAWDNRSTHHYASYDYYPQARKMQRVTTVGEPVLGVEGDYVPETVEGNGQVMPRVHGTGGRTRQFERT